MNNLEQKMVDLLIELKADYNVTGVKAEFEDEGASFDEAMRLKEFAAHAGADLTVKIGGCGALNDLYETKNIAVNAIVAPMVESDYALKKFVHSTHCAYVEEERKNISLYINIETVNGYNNINEIFQAAQMSEVEGIILGRVDMAGSIDLTREDVNSNEMLAMANTLAIKALEHNKKFIIGGNVTSESLEFFKLLPLNSLHAFETRKVIFDAQVLKCGEEKVSQGILKAINFELFWLKNKRDFYNSMRAQDFLRLSALETLYGDKVYA